MAYHSSVGCDLGGDQPTGYATSSACFHTPEITITHPLTADSQLIRQGLQCLRFGYAQPVASGQNIPLTLGQLTHHGLQGNLPVPLPQWMVRRHGFATGQAVSQGDGTVTLGDSLASGETMSPDHPLRQRDRQITLQAMMGELTERERDILSRRYGLGVSEPETLQTLSDQLGISRERVSYGDFWCMEAG